MIRDRELNLDKIVQQLRAANTRADNADAQVVDLRRLNQTLDTEKIRGVAASGVRADDAEKRADAATRDSEKAARDLVEARATIDEQQRVFADVETRLAEAIEKITKIKK